MTKLSWSDPKDRTFETGLDHGVLYLKTGAAVAWNGLTGVDENGGDSGAEYYMDGRPFLFFPKPKEFTASLKAYTYPDLFSSVMGVKEVADGMLLDSQVGEVFDLSYRTLVGDAIDGLDRGYKLHLVYNATVVPTSISYAPVTNDISPIEFSWDIQAVPVSVDGYRDTAHIVIDTRHIEPAKLSQLEVLLYGDPNTVSSILEIPQPQTIFDLLSYGDTILIIDNGDGTWDAVGSYEYIYMIGDGLFEIDGVNAVDNGDGTYYVSSTP